MMNPIASLTLLASLALSCAPRDAAPPMRWNNQARKQAPGSGLRAPGGGPDGASTTSPASSPSPPAPGSDPPSTTSPTPTPAPGSAPPSHPDHSSGFHLDFSDADRFARHFDDPARDAWQKPDEVIRVLALTAGQVVVDLGSGTGYFVERLARAVGPRGRVLALDVEPKMVAHVSERSAKAGLTNVESRRVEPDDPGLAPASVDRVLIVNTWHHIDRRSDYAAKLARALEPEGEIWIVDFTLESDLGPPAKHRLSAQQVVSELQRADLDASVVEPEGLPKQYLVRARRRAAR